MCLTEHLNVLPTPEIALPQISGGEQSASEEGEVDAGPNKETAMSSETELTLRTWLWDFLMEHIGSEEWYYGLLDRDHWNGFDVPLNPSEQDRAEMLHDVVDALAALLGNEHAAGRWLCHAEAFKLAAACSPIDHLKSGEFDALCLLRDFILVAKENPDDPLGLRLEFA